MEKAIDIVSKRINEITESMDELYSLIVDYDDRKEDVPSWVYSELDKLMDVRTELRSILREFLEAAGKKEIVEYMF